MWKFKVPEAEVKFPNAREIERISMLTFLCLCWETLNERPNFTEVTLGLILKQNLVT